LDLSEDTSLPIAQLKRILEFPTGAYHGQIHDSILSIIRKQIISKEEFSQMFPIWINQYNQIEEKFNTLCTTIQGIYDSVKSQYKESVWNLPSTSKESKQIADQIVSYSKTFAPILFFMKKSQIDSVRQLFQTEQKAKFLRDEMNNN